MIGYSKLQIIGHLGRDPEMSYTPEGTALTKFSVAVNRRVKDKDETDWYNVEVWGKLGEACNQYLHSGSLVLVDGSLRSWEYEGKTYWSLKARDVVFLDKKPAEEEVGF